VWHLVFRQSGLAIITFDRANTSSFNFDFHADAEDRFRLRPDQPANWSMTSSVGGRIRPNSGREHFLDRQRYSDQV
jgi:hypothetical protein